MIAVHKISIFCRYYGRFCEVTTKYAESGLNPFCRRRQPSQPKQNGLYADFQPMSICCGHFFFQHDTVGFL